MKIYVCWDTRAKYINHVHPCGAAYHALKDAGYDPEVTRARGWNKLPDFPFNATSGRKAVKQMTGKLDVPVLVLDDGEVVAGSKEIIAWAAAHPAAAAAPAA